MSDHTTPHYNILNIQHFAIYILFSCLAIDSVSVNNSPSPAVMYSLNVCSTTLKFINTISTSA